MSEKFKNKKIMEIRIEDYLNHEEIKETVQYELRNQVKAHFRDEENAKRLLSNLAYHIVQEEINKIVPNYHEDLVKKVSKLIRDEQSVSFNLFDFDSYGLGRRKSLGAIIVEQTVEENKQLIKDKIIEAIQNKDYSEVALTQLERLSDSFASNIYDFVELMRGKDD